MGEMLKYLETLDICEQLMTNQVKTNIQKQFTAEELDEISRGKEQQDENKNIGTELNGSSQRATLNMLKLVKKKIIEEVHLLDTVLPNVEIKTSLN